MARPIDADVLEKKASRMSLFDNRDADLFIDLIESLPTTQSGWIPVGERLPDRSDKVFFTVRFDGLYGGWREVFSGVYRNEWFETELDSYSKDGGRLNLDLDYLVTAWMPYPDKPEPYEGE